MEKTVTAGAGGGRVLVGAVGAVRVAVAQERRVDTPSATAGDRG